MLNLNNADKSNKRFMYQNLQKSKCYQTNFSESNFDYASFRGAHLKSCSFFKGSFKGAEFIGVNLKGSNFRNAQFENTVFEGSKLEGVDFMGSVFINTFFVGTPLENTRNLDLKNPEIRVFDQMPDIEISEALKNEFERLMANPYVAKSRVLDTKNKTLNTISVLILKEKFSEESLLKSLGKLDLYLDRDFYTLSYLIKLIEKILEGEA